MRILRRLTIAVLALLGCGLVTSGSSSTVTADLAAWAPPDQLQIGTLPTHETNVDGYGFYPAPSDAHPVITQAQAESDAVTTVSLYAGTGQPLRIRHTSLMTEQYRDGSRFLVWVVDTSPDNPFPGGPGTAPDRWSWIVVNATTGAYGSYAA